MRHYQIYWPYSQKWNGSDLPVITFKTKESPLLPQDENIGYRIKEGFVETVLVNEEYAKQHPVWIINYNPIPYEEYPDFAQQNWVSKIFDWYDFEDYYKEGEILTQKIIVYAKENKSLYNRPDYAKASMVDTKNDTLSLYLKSVTFDKKDRRLHSLFSGGAHYIFNIQLTDINDINYLDYGNSGNSKYYKKWFYNTELVGVRFVYLRSEMTEGSVKTLDNLMSWHWLPYEYSFPVTLIQEFGGDKYIFIEDILYYVYYGPYYAFLEEREPNIGNFGMSLVGFMPLQINDELLYHSDYARYSGRMYSEGMIYYEDYVVSEYLTCELDVTKGMSIPSWYTPTAQ